MGCIYTDIPPSLRPCYIGLESTRKQHTHRLSCSVSWSRLVQARFYAVCRIKHSSFPKKARHKVLTTEWVVLKFKWQSRKFRYCVACSHKNNGRPNSVTNDYNMLMTTEWIESSCLRLKFITSKFQTFFLHPTPIVGLQYFHHYHQNTTTVITTCTGIRLYWFTVTVRRVLEHRAFLVVGPRTWNDLPDDVTSAELLSTFRQRLKTHLFTKSFFWLFPGLDFT